MQAEFLTNQMFVCIYYVGYSHFDSQRSVTAWLCEEFSFIDTYKLKLLCHSSTLDGRGGPDDLQ